jgi:hypothetical protein
MIGSGVGDLAENGAGGSQLGEAGIVPESPYVLETRASAGFDTNTWLVVDNRLFKVDEFKVLGGIEQHAHAYLSEIVGAALPVEGAAP